MKKLSLIIATFFVVSGIVKAQPDSNSASHTVGINISNLAILDIETMGVSNDINFNITSPTEAGEGISYTGIKNDSLWLNYSSIVSAGKTRSVSATISGTLPGGTTISVAAADPVSNYGKGKKGTANTTPQVLTSNGIKVIDGIGSCYTGDGAGRGSNLTYTLNLDESNYDALYDGSYSATITYTISDQQ